MTDPFRVVHKKTGTFLEDFKPGQLFRHKGGKTVTEGLFTLFSDFSMGTNPFTQNARYARAFGYRDLTCSPGLVMLNVGADNNVQRGFTFEIYRGSTYKGKVRVENVQGKYCSAVIIDSRPGTTIAQGDRAATNL